MCLEGAPDADGGVGVVAGAVVGVPDADAVAVGGVGPRGRGAVVEPPRDLVPDAVAAVVPEAVAEGAVAVVRTL